MSSVRERAAFIRFRCEFPEWDASHPRFRELAERERRFEPFFKEWLKQLPAPAGVEWWKSLWGRGFMFAVTFAWPKAFTNHADAVFAAAPVQLVKVDKVGDRTIGRVLQSDYLKRLNALIFAGTYGVAAVRQIAACPNFARLDALSIWGGCPDEGAEALAASPHLGSLTCLSLSNHTLTDRGVTALLDAEQLRGLTSLVLHGTGGLGRKVVHRLKERFGAAW